MLCTNRVSGYTDRSRTHELLYGTVVFRFILCVIRLTIINDNDTHTHTYPHTHTHTPTHTLVTMATIHVGIRYVYRPVFHRKLTTYQSLYIYIYIYIYIYVCVCVGACVFVNTINCILAYYYILLCKCINKLLLSSVISSIVY